MGCANSVENVFWDSIFKQQTEAATDPGHGVSESTEQAPEDTTEAAATTLPPPPPPVTVALAPALADDHEEFWLPTDLRQGSCNPRRFWNTTYLKLYDCVDKQVPINLVIDGLAQVVDDTTVQVDGVDQHDMWQLLKRAGAGDKDALNDRQFHSAVIAQWTGVGGRGRNKEKSVPLYKLLNRAVVRDEAETLKHWMPFIRLLNSVLTAPEHFLHREVTVWRGSKMSEEDLVWAVKGRIVRSALFVAASLERNVAEMFCAHKVLLEITVPKNCRNACPIYRMSKLEEEREVLFPAYSAFLVQKVYRDKEHIILKLMSLDNMVVSSVERFGMVKDLLGDDVPVLLPIDVTCKPM